MKKTIPMILAAILAVVLVSSVCVLLFTCYIQQTVALGVHLSSLPLEGKTLARAKETVLLAAEGITEQTVTVSYSNVEVAFTLAEIGAKIDWEDGINRCYQLGKTGNVFVRCKDILAARLGKTTLYPTVSYNENQLKKKLMALQNRIKTPVREATAQASEEYILITAGEKGEVFDYDLMIRNILDTLLDDKETPITLTTKTGQPREISVEKLADIYFKDPVNAQYTTQDGEISIIPDEDGVSFDKDLAQKLLNEKKKFCRIPLIYTKARVTYSDLDTNILKDTIATYTTSYGSGDEGRNYNVELAAERLNGIIVESGETFSFTEKIGDGSEERGFRKANVYSRGEVVTEYGGGLCQAASTLYSAVLYANLEIVSRTAHELPVSYISAGQDVTISSDIDFQFKNNQLFPIRILTSTNGSTLTITLQGTIANPNQTVTIHNSVTETIPYPSKTVMTDELKPGEQKILQQGKDGCIVSTYRMITENGETIQNDLISTSRYNPIPKVIREGVEGISWESEKTEE